MSLLLLPLLISADPEEEGEPSGDSTVYVLTTGKKFHKDDCEVLKGGGKAMKLSEARQIYEPCPVCKPLGDIDKSKDVKKVPVPERNPSKSNVEEKKDPAADEIVYVTTSGSKYHRDDCEVLKGAGKAMKLSQAAKDYGPCPVCKPPRLK